MNAIFQQISEQDISSLLGLMREFYQQQHMRFDEVVAAKAVTKLLADPSLGQICFIYRGSELAGYFVLTICVSLEFHGNFALLDELYVREAFRRQKLGTTVISFVENLCRQKGIKALRLEVGRTNDGAQRLYRASGFTEDARYLYTKWL
jgi:ribosomal protein S18 acetylase RimI-like enzyme